MTLNYKYGLSVNLDKQPIVPGTIYFTLDTHHIYLDTNEDRIEMLGSGTPDLEQIKQAITEAIGEIDGDYESIAAAINSLIETIGKESDGENAATGMFARIEALEKTSESAGLLWGALGKE